VLADAHGELQRGIENVEYASYAPELLKGEHSRNVGPGIDSGRVPGAGRGGRHHALQLSGHGAAVDVAHGRGLRQHLRAQALRARPVALRIAELALEAGLPPGVLNVVNGDKEAVDTLLRPARQGRELRRLHPHRRIHLREGCKHGKRVQALGGAKNHAVLMPDADIANAVSALMGAAYGSAASAAWPSRCSWPWATRWDAVIAGLKAEIAKMKVGPGTDNGNDMGPLVTKQHFEKVKAYVDSGVAEGATLVVDGRGVKVAGHEDGYFLGACLFDNVKPGMKIYQEEIFGPVLGVVRVQTLQEAMQLINDHEYGNGTCIFTRDGEAARYFTDHIQVGMVGVNVPLPVPVAYHSFGGWKRSLFGDLHAYGPDAVRFYTKRKTITQRWPSAACARGGVQLSEQPLNRGAGGLRCVLAGVPLDLEHLAVQGRTFVDGLPWTLRPKSDAVGFRHLACAQCLFEASLSDTCDWSASSARS
jgi:malonate-semialdehyde dehydrogenase (acetylating)/methylmalonate-semialdehyde dehydrogenase